MEDSVALIIQFLQALTGLAGVFIAILVYQVSRQQKREAWLTIFNQLSEQFWADQVFIQVRSWLVCDEDYAKLKAVLEKRFRNRSELSIQENNSLEKLDKYFNFLMRVKVVNPEFKRQRKLWEKLYFLYWMNKIFKSKRYELWVYYTEYFTVPGSQYILTLKPTNEEEKEFMEFEEKCYEIKKKLHLLSENSS